MLCFSPLLHPAIPKPKPPDSCGNTPQGAYLALFWVIFNLGAVFGGILTAATNWTSEAPAASASTYAAFLGIMAIGCGLSLLLADPSTVRRPDGTLLQTGSTVEVPRYTSLLFLLTNIPRRKKGLGGENRVEGCGPSYGRRAEPLAPTIFQWKVR